MASLTDWRTGTVLRKSSEDKAMELILGILIGGAIVWFFRPKIGAVIELLKGKGESESGKSGEK